MANIAIIRSARSEFGRITQVIDGITGLRYRFGTAIGEEPLETGVETQDHATALPITIMAIGQVGTLNGGRTAARSDGHASRHARSAGSLPRRDRVRASSTR